MDPFDYHFSAAAFVMLVPIVAIVGGITYAIIALRQKTRLQELAYRERIARIERGLPLVSEADPSRRDDAWSLPETFERSERAGRAMSGGIMLVGVGLGLMLMLRVLTGSAEVGVGVGGFLTIIGIAMIVNAVLQSRAVPPRSPTPAQRPSADENPQPPRL